MQSALKELYPTVNDIDAIVGALCEAHNGTGLLTGTFEQAVEREYIRLRDGDRFWYLNNQFSAQEVRRKCAHAVLGCRLY